MIEFVYKDIKMSWEFHDIMIRKMLYGYVATSIPSTSTNYFGDVRNSR